MRPFYLFMEKLTPRERSVLKLILQKPEIAAPQIAKELGLKRSEVREAFMEIYRKLRASTRQSILSNVSTYWIGEQDK